MDTFERMRRCLPLRESSTAEMQYGGESQSGKSLPLIYVPFDVGNPNHWGDRGSALDFALSVGPGRVLDFGPGDGWPSLIVAPFVEDVVGVDGSSTRVSVCMKNAARIGAHNASFVYVPPGEHLPFCDGSFDGVMASSSIEESPDPRKILEEMYRVLKPGGAMRFDHAGFMEYIGKPTHSVDLLAHDGQRTRMDIWERRIDEEWVRHLVLLMDLTVEQVQQVFQRHGQSVSHDGLTNGVLVELGPYVLDAPYFRKTCAHTTTFVRWLREIGFRDVQVTHSGRWFAHKLFHQVAESHRPNDHHGVDALLRPLIPIVISMPKPPEHSDYITAAK